MKKTNKFQVTYTDSEQHLTRVEVVEVGTKRFNEIALRAMDPEEENIVGSYVPDDTPIGLVGKAKQLHYREKSGYVDKQINYEVKDGTIKFLDFLPFEIYGYKIDKHRTDSGDLLKVITKSAEIIPIDKATIRDLTYLLRRIQKFNDELLDELYAEEIDDSDFEDGTQEDVIENSFDQAKNQQNTGMFD